MKYFYFRLIAFCFSMLIDFPTFAQIDIYKKDIIRYNLKEQAGKKRR
jgi:hypothetical protein